MNSDNGKTSGPHRLFLSLTDKINLGGSDKYVALSNLGIYYTWKNIKKSYNNLKYQLQPGMKNSNYLMERILYQILKIILSISSKKMKHLLTILQ